MGFEADDEILQDFLVESGEILELLSEQLVDLEQNPDDKDLLNAIFRGFHTVKGGAGFLQLDALVKCCHIAENVFDILRNGKRSLDADLMDVVLRALDSVNEMFSEVRDGQDPTPADPQLLSELERFAKPADAAPAAEPAAVEPTPEPVAAEASAEEADITDDEFEQLLDALDDDAGKGSAPAASEQESDEITDDEFENLLDELHGSGAPVGVSESAGASASPDSSSADLFFEEPAAGGDTNSSPESGDISEEEFEKLLDDLHGEGQFNSEGIAAGDATSEASATPAGGDGELITDNEFEKLLDELHGAGGSPTTKAAASSAPAPEPTPKPAPAPAPASAAAAKPKPAAKPAAKAASKKNETIATETTVRVDTKRLDDIMNMVGELVLVRNRLKRLGDASSDESMQKAVSNLDVVTGDLQSAVMQTRMQPIKKVFGRFPRVVRDLARNLKKEVNLVLVGEDTDLDKNLVEALSDPLVHLVRNAVDHGIEMPDDRVTKGKERIGQVVLSAQQEGDHIMLAIEDDGAGMDAEVLRQKAVEKGIYDQDAADRLSDSECYNLIFAPGFSTKQEISDISGRGVGMDVVKTKITQLNGTVNIDSELGKGSRLSIKVPLTLAIMPTLMVKLGNQSFAFPLVSVVEIFHLDLTKTNVVDGQECVVVRDNVYPLFYIKRWLVNSYTEDTDSAHVVIVAVGSKRVGFIVDQLVGQEEVVIKPLGDMLHGTAGMAGATITGDGRIALILDIPSLLDRYA
ncbi:chemotaxis protein CheA [Oleiphilus sp. HI0078]|uniref:chemotaxis protein CheA n=3 Tax=Oleiphilus TaxID=141450 RepID=UPI0007C36F7E|nr:MULTISPECIES: chemotaxis protein CheA [unclassified Oleiphilus]KZY80201.1 chemotaxis protein CheA [Oleiphilus sp. HI0069]KZZ17032.1 chemotaxis protein CheA [Oleiphilus sp. HI0078]KZY29976.1 chemotaxis protein CheA [Oleiphilus sp. HI0043]KZY51679.1 chemotaxis protein CheA [Oleiphilus sp. HI0061]KZZ72194.1 chemotaxis protein CheA [Oleiphilus sp. HI0132]